MTTIINKNFIAALGIALGVFFVAPLAFAGSYSTIETVPASNVTDSSATLQAYFVSDEDDYRDGSYPQVVFEYGTSRDLEKATSAMSQREGARTVTARVSRLPEDDTIYYRAVLYTQSGIEYGDVLSFQTTEESPVFVFPSKLSNVQSQGTGGGNGSGSGSGNGSNGTNGSGSSNGENSGGTLGQGDSYVFVSIENDEEKINQGDIVTYEVVYKNISGQELENATLIIETPEEMTVLDTSGARVRETQDGLTVKLGDLKPGEDDTIKVTGRMNKRSSDKQVIARADVVYGIDSARDTHVATAYDVDEYTGVVNVALGASVFGAGFFPATLFGWMIVLAIIVLIMFIARRFYYRQSYDEVWVREENRPVAMNEEYSN